MSSTGAGSSDVKTVISVPAETYGRVERLALRLGITRSEFYARAVVRLADELEPADLTAAVDRAVLDL